MLADELDFMVGVDPHRDVHAIGVVEVRSGWWCLSRACRRQQRLRGSSSRGTLLALRALTRRVQQLTAEERELARELEELASTLAPQPLTQPGIWPTARRPARARLVTPRPPVSEAAFAKLAGAAPIPASSGQTIRHRLDRSGDRQLNRALHQIILTRRGTPDPPSTTSCVESRKGEAAARPHAASNATSTDSSSTRRRRLDKHRSIPTALRPVRIIEVVVEVDRRGCGQRSERTPKVERTARPPTARRPVATVLRVRRVTLQRHRGRGPYLQLCGRVALHLRGTFQAIDAVRGDMRAQTRPPKVTTPPAFRLPISPTVGGETHPRITHVRVKDYPLPPDETGIHRPSGKEIYMLAKLKQRVAVRDQSGFTLIELLVVLIIIGVLLAIAVPSYLGFKDRAEQRAAASDVRAAIPSAEAFFSDNNTYVGLSKTALLGIDSGLSNNLATVSSTASTYCISAKVGNWYAHVDGPGGPGVVSKENADAC